MKKVEKEQFNTRLPADLKRAVVTAAAALGWSYEEMSEIAMATLLGSPDAIINAKRRKVMETAKSLRLSFERAGLQRIRPEEKIAA